MVRERTTYESLPFTVPEIPFSDPSVPVECLEQLTPVQRDIFGDRDRYAARKYLSKIDGNRVIGIICQTLGWRWKTRVRIVTMEGG
jgi:hypothetical protein